MNIEDRLASLFAEIRREVRKNPAFAERIAIALNTALPKEQPRSNRRAPSVIDPFTYLQQGQHVLKAKLEELSIEQLKDIVAEHGMDRAKLAMKWKAKDRLVSLIVTTVANRARKGDAFRGPSKPQTPSQPDAKEPSNTEPSFLMAFPPDAQH